MSGHTSWEQLKREFGLPDSTYLVTADVLSYCEGYILACEDALEDLKEIGKRPKLLGDGSFEHALDLMKTRLERSLSEARATIKVLVERSKDAAT